jgi:uroporphyrinogen III methyltransferase/synthase
MREMRMDIRSLAGVKLAAIGRGTAARLEARGLLVDLVPEKYDGQALGQTLADVLHDGEKLLIPRARIGNQELIREIRTKRDVTIVDLPIYETLLPGQSEGVSDHLMQELAERKELLAVFTSASTVRGFAELAEDLDLHKVQAVCSGAQTKAEADRLGMETSVAEQATVESLVDAVLERAKVLKSTKSETQE